MTKLNSCFENTCKVFYKLAEVNAPVRRKVEENFAVVKGVLNIYELHLKTVLCDFFFAYLKSFLFFSLIFLKFLKILICRNADDGLKRCHYLVVLNEFIGSGDRAAFNASCGFNYDTLSFGQLYAFGVKAVYLADLFESYTNYFSHSYLL